MSTNFQKTVLVVDDEQDVRDYLTAALQDYGFNTLTAEDGSKAIEILNEQTPDLISLDLVMPKHSGIKFYHDIQKNKKWSKIPILIVTGHARDEMGKVDFETMMLQGPGIYLEKPVKPNNYIQKVCQMLNLTPPEDLELQINDDNETLRKQLIESLSKADTESLKKAFDAIKENKS